MAIINTGVSDLFFNHDKSEAVVKDKDGLITYDSEKLEEVAEDFIVMLEAVGRGRDEFDAQDLIIDFMARL